MSRHPQAAPPAILTIGSALVQGLDWLSRVDFLISLQSTKLAEFLQSVVDYAWIGVVVGLIWWWWEAKFGKGKKRSSVVTLLIVGVVAFLLGSIVAIKNANQPNLIFSRGRDTNPPNCNVTVDTGKLKNKAKEYDLLLVCGIADDRVDFMRDKAVNISTPRSITIPQVRIESQLTTQQWSERFSKQSTWWFQMALIPKNTDPASYANLEEIEKVGGLVVGNRPGIHN